MQATPLGERCVLPGQRRLINCGQATLVPATSAVRVTRKRKASSRRAAHPVPALQAHTRSEFTRSKRTIPGTPRISSLGHYTLTLSPGWRGFLQWHSIQSHRVYWYCVTFISGNRLALLYPPRCGEPTPPRCENAFVFRPLRRRVLTLPSRVSALRHWSLPLACQCVVKRTNKCE